MKFLLFFPSARTTICYRVATFYATEADPLPDGDVERAKPNNYGPWVLEYEHLEDFVPAADLVAIRPVLRARLYENWALEKSLLANLTDDTEDRV